MVQAFAALEELRDFQQRYRQDADAADVVARKAYENAYDVLEKHPSRRTQGEKARAIEVLTTAQADLGVAIASLSAGAAYRDSGVEEQRQGRIAYLRAEVELLASSEKFIQEDKNLINANETALQELIGKIKDLQRRFFNSP